MAGWLHYLLGALDGVILDRKHLLVEQSAMVVRNGLLRILWADIGHSGRPHELPKLVTVESADFEFANFFEDFLKRKG